MARQAIKGPVGSLRFSLNIPVRVGRREILAAISYFLPEDSDVLPVSRTEAKRIARDFLALYGTVGVDGTVPMAVSAKRMSCIKEHIDGLFEELVEIEE